MGNTEDNTKIPKTLKKFIRQLKRQRFGFVIGKVVMAIILCLILILIFIIFTMKNDAITLDSNGIRLLWVIVILDVVGLAWTLLRSFQQMKRYRSCIIRLKTLYLKKSIKTSDPNKQISEEEICKEVEEIVKEFCYGRIEEDCTEDLPTEGSQQVTKD
jgi:Ca2+/Na+ antiporter